MLKMSLAVLALLSATAPLGAQTAAPRYDLQVRVLEGDTVLGAPHLVAAAGEAATMLSDDGHGHGWNVIMTATPTAAPGRVTVKVNARRWRDAVRQSATTELVLDEGKTATLALPADMGTPQTRIEMNVRGA